MLSSCGATFLCMVFLLLGVVFWCALLLLDTLGVDGLLLLVFGLVGESLFPDLKTIPDMVRFGCITPTRHIGHLRLLG